MLLINNSLVHNNRRIDLRTTNLSISFTGVATCYSYGDPHFRSFDGKLFSYQGTCKYNLASPCNSSQQPYFNVYAKSENRPNVSSSVSFPSYVEIIYNSATVRLSRLTDSSTQAAVPVLVTVCNFSSCLRNEGWMIMELIVYSNRNQFQTIKRVTDIRIRG
jgi:von Willebrand factor type D domain